MFTHQHPMKKEPPKRCSTCDALLSLKHILKRSPTSKRILSQNGLPRDVITALGEEENIIIDIFKSQR